MLPPDITVVGCGAHAMRKFDGVINTVSLANRVSYKTMKGKGYCDALFTMENELANLVLNQRKQSFGGITYIYSQVLADALGITHFGPKMVI